MSSNQLDVRKELRRDSKRDSSEKSEKGFRKDTARAAFATCFACFPQWHRAPEEDEEDQTNPPSSRRDELGSLLQSIEYGDAEMDNQRSPRIRSLEGVYLFAAGREIRRRAVAIGHREDWYYQRCWSTEDKVLAKGHPVLSDWTLSDMNQAVGKLKKSGNKLEELENPQIQQAVFDKEGIRTVSDYNIEKESTPHLVLQLLGGMQNIRLNVGWEDNNA